MGAQKKAPSGIASIDALEHRVKTTIKEIAKREHLEECNDLRHAAEQGDVTRVFHVLRREGKWASMYIPLDNTPEARRARAAAEAKRQLDQEYVNWALVAC